MSVYRLMIIVVVLFCSVICISRAEPPSKVSALVSTNKVSSDEVFDMQIHIESNTDDITPPDLSEIKDFKHSYLGASRSSKTVISNVNGKQKMVTENVIILNYKFMPLKEGKLNIPSLSVEVEGKVYKTDKIPVVVSKNKEQQNMSFLRYKLPRNKTFVGETIPVELVWYFRNNPQLNSIDVPSFTDDRFVVSKMSMPKKVDQGQRLIEISFNGGKYWALQGEAIVDGVAYVTLTMKWYIAPKELGSIELKPSTIVASYITGYRENPMFRGIPKGFSSVFDDDSFFNAREPVMKQIATRTEPVKIDVEALPVKGRPDNFSGVVSKIQLGAEASTDKASVGEPIEVDLFVSGSDNIYNMTLPDFNKQSDIQDKFKVIADTNDNAVVGNMRKFKLIFRALNSNVHAIPPLKVAYYDPQEKDYKEAKTWEIPIKIKAAKIVSASDIETNAKVAKVLNKVKENNDGIFENYTDDSVLLNQNVSIGQYLSNNKVFFSVFPGCYFTILLGQLVLGRRKLTENSRAASRAVKTFNLQLKSLGNNELNAENISKAIICYYKVKFQAEDKEFTLSEIYNMLEKITSINDETLINLKKIIDYCEACCYTGKSDHQLSSNFVESVSAVISRIDLEIK